MKTLIVYDSFFGNTEQIAQAMGRALGSPEDVEVRRVSQVQPAQLTGLGLLIVGSPTRGFKPSPAIANLLGSIPENGLRGVKVAAFDTRISMSDVKQPVLRFIGRLLPMRYAAPAIAATLQGKGGELIAPPEGFLVKDTEGPLNEGELERAAGWVRQITGGQ